MIVTRSLEFLLMMYVYIVNKMLSYRRETMLQGALVLTKSERLELRDNNFTDIISLSSTTVT